MRNEPKSQVDKEMMYDKELDSHFDTRSFRDNLYNRFSRNMLLLLDSKKPRTTFTNKGRLEPRRAYRYNFSDQLFKQNQSVPTGDTTIIFLIDGSGSMSGQNRIEKCNAICSAFAKAVNDVTKNQIKFECFVKHSPSIYDSEYGGSFVTLTKVLSNTQGAEKDFDKILRLNTDSPLRLGGGDKVGSYTAEFSVLPALRKYMMKRLTTKNAIIVNLTDGGAFASLGTHRNCVDFRSRENGQMRIKYLSQIPHVTVMVGGELRKKEREIAYGQNVVECEDDSFVPNLFKMFMGFLEQSYE